MAKRLLDLSNEESKFRKKIKLENEFIWDKTKDVNNELDVNQHEVEKFLSIFHILMETVRSEENLNNTDSVSDTILTIILKITELLKKNIDSLKIPEILKIALEKIKSLFDLKTEENSSNTKQPGESEEAIETPRDGSEKHGEDKS